MINALQVDVIHGNYMIAKADNEIRKLIIEDL